MDTLTIVLVGIIVFCVFKMMALHEMAIKSEIALKEQIKKTSELNIAVLATLAAIKKSRKSDSSGNDSDDELLMTALRRAGIDASQVNLPSSGRRRGRRTIIQNITGPTTNNTTEYNVKAQLNLPFPFSPIGGGAGGALAAGLAGILAPQRKMYSLRH